MNVKDVFNREEEQNKEERGLISLYSGDGYEIALIRENGQAKLIEKKEVKTIQKTKLEITQFLLRKDIDREIKEHVLETLGFEDVLKYAKYMVKEAIERKIECKVCKIVKEGDECKVECDVWMILDEAEALTAVPKYEMILPREIRDCIYAYLEGIYNTFSNIDDLLEWAGVSQKELMEMVKRVGGENAKD